MLEFTEVKNVIADTAADLAQLLSTEAEHGDRTTCCNSDTNATPGDRQRHRGGRSSTQDDEFQEADLNIITIHVVSEVFGADCFERSILRAPTPE